MFSSKAYTSFYERNISTYKNEEACMADCECLPKCPFFNDKMADKPATAGMMKKQYCQGDSSGCARHQVKVAAGSENVPADLYPSQTYRVKEVLSALGKG